MIDCRRIFVVLCAPTPSPVLVLKPYAVKHTKHLQLVNNEKQPHTCVGFVSMRTRLRSCVCARRAWLCAVSSSASAIGTLFFQLTTQLNSQLNSTQLTTQLNSTQLTTQLNSTHNSTHNSTQLNSQLNSTQLSTQLNSQLNSTQLTTQLTTQLNSTQLNSTHTTATRRYVVEQQRHTETTTCAISCRR
jgi:hypothetical protein